MSFAGDGTNFARSSKATAIAPRAQATQPLQQVPGVRHVPAPAAPGLHAAGVELSGDGTQAGGTACPYVGDHWVAGVGVGEGGDDGAERREIASCSACASVATIPIGRDALLRRRRRAVVSALTVKERTMTRRPVRLAAVAVICLVGPLSGAMAQMPADACGLMSRDEFQALTGRTEYGDPTGMPWSGGTVCGFDNGQIILLTQADSAQVMDRFLANAEKDLVSPRTPVDGLGEGAFSVSFDPENPYQDHGVFVVFGAGPPTVAVTVYAEDGEPAEAALAPAMAVSEAVSAKLP